MPRFPLCLLLSLGLHIACGGLLREPFALVGEARAEALPLVVQLVNLQAPVAAPSSAVAPPPAASVAQNAPATPEAVAHLRPQSKAVLLKKSLAPPSKPLAQTERAPSRPAPTPAAEPVAAAAPVAVDVLAKAGAPRVASQSAKPEVLSRNPAFHAPPAPPRYPAQARRRNQQGVVLVEVRLDEHGTQRELKLLRSSGVDSLDQAALDAVAVWRFQAEVRDGQNVPSRVQIPIQFALTANR
jgi:protein TonB